MIKTEYLRERIAKEGYVAFQKYYGLSADGWENYIGKNFWYKIADQILQTLIEAKCVFVADDQTLPERQGYEVKGILSLNDALLRGDIYLQGQIDAFREQTQRL